MNKQFPRFTFFLLMCLTFSLTATAQVVDIPDPNLRAAVEKALGKASGATITAADMTSLTRLEAPEAGISNLTGLESATNLTFLNFWKNSISDISRVAGLTQPGSATSSAQQHHGHLTSGRINQPDKSFS